MARSDYASILDRYAGKGETLAGRLMDPVLDATRPDGCTGHAVVDPAAIHGNRWPALYGGFLFDLAERVARRAVPGAMPLALDVHFLRAIRRADVPEPQGLRLPWRATMTPARAGIVAVTTRIGPEDDPFVPPEPFRDPKIVNNPNITLEMTSHGGHCGFVAESNGYDGYWAERRIVEFVEARL